MYFIYLCHIFSGKTSTKVRPISFYKIGLVCLLYVLLCVRFLIDFAPASQPGSGFEELSALRKRLKEAILERQNTTDAQSEENGQRISISPKTRREIKLERKSSCQMRMYFQERAVVCQQAAKYPPLFINHNDPRKYNSCDLHQIFDNCLAVQQSYIYGKDRVSLEEKQFPLAFAMKIHTSANQAHRLLRIIYRKHNVYCIHVDKKAPSDIFNYFRHIGDCFDNIIVIDDRVSVVYSSIKQIEAEFRCVDAMLNSSHKWKYYINLSGQEFMLRTNLELVRILKLLNGSNEVESYVMSKERHKFQRRTIINRNHAMITKERKEPFDRNVSLRKGSAYGMLTREFLHFARTDLQAQRFFQWLQDVYAPEEMIWATLNAFPNAPGGTKREVTSMGNTFISRAVIWESENRFKCNGKYVHWVCIYGLFDLEWLKRHRNIVANKFYESYQPLSLDCLEMEIYQRTMGPTGEGERFNLSRYHDIMSIHSNIG